jgi:N-acetylneuraminate synthase
MISFFRERYGCAVGLSDHSGTIYPGIAAAALGAEVIEVHITFSREMFGPDVSSSLTTAELRQLVDGVRFIEKAWANPINKDGIADDLTLMRNLFTKSVVAKRDLAAGTILQESDLATRKPGSGIPADRIRDLINRRLKRSAAANTFLSEDDIE